MNGTGHYVEAERDIERSYTAPTANGAADFCIARAQVHATLALAAATALTVGHTELSKWQDVAS